MAEFLQSYGIWIVLGLLFLFMLRGRARGGGGCCGGGHQHDQDSNQVPEKAKDEQVPIREARFRVPLTGENNVAKVFEKAERS